MCDNLGHLDLEYLINKEQYNKPVEKHLNNSKNKLNENKKYLKDKKFYKKRILSLTKNLYNQEDIQSVNNDIINIFDSYIKSCIEYFKHLDTNDLFQEDFKELKISTNNVSIPLEESMLNTNNEILIGNVKKKTNALDNFVKKIPLPNKNEIIIPKQKKVNLKDPKLKDKGIEKNNINKYYDEENKKN